MSKEMSKEADDTNEYLEEFTEEGKGTGKKIVRGEAHSEGLWHAVSHIWILDRKGNLLLQKRSEKKKAFPGAYDVSAAGHVSFGKSPIEAAVEECFEELGLKVEEKDLELIGIFNQMMILNQGSFINKEIVFTYILELEEIKLEELIIQPSELDGVGLIFWSVFRDMLKKKDKRVVDVDPDTEYLRTVWKILQEKYSEFSPSSNDFKIRNRT